MIEKLEKLLSDCLDKLSDESQPIELKDKIISDIDKITLSIIDYKKTISDIIDVVNISTLSDKANLLKSQYLLKSLANDLQKFIDDSTEFIINNQPDDK